MSLKITQVHIWGIFKTTKVGNASFMIAGQGRRQRGGRGGDRRPNYFEKNKINKY